VGFRLEHDPSDADGGFQIVRPAMQIPPRGGAGGGGAGGGGGLGGHKSMPVMIGSHGHSHSLGPGHTGGLLANGPGGGAGEGTPLSHPSPSAQNLLSVSHHYNSPSKSILKSPLRKSTDPLTASITMATGAQSAAAAAASGSGLGSSVDFGSPPHSMLPPPALGGGGNAQPVGSSGASGSGGGGPSSSGNPAIKRRISFADQHAQELVNIQYRDDLHYSEMADHSQGEDYESGNSNCSIM
jgi:hypothetical protein